jgi:rhodanese-related sulfurtransferase
MVKLRYNYLLLLLIIIIVYILYVYLSQSPIHKSSLKISIKEARARRFGLIIDVRTLKERELLGFYPNSIPISNEMLQQLPLDVPNKNTWILIYCNRGNRAAKAADILYKLGYKNVRYIDQSYLSLLPGSS